MATPIPAVALRHRRGPAAAVPAVCGASVAALSAGFLVSNRITLAALMALAIVLVIALAGAWRVVTSGFDPFEPVWLFLVVYGVMFTVRPLAMIVKDDFGYQIGPASVDVRSGFEPMLVLGLVGAVGFAAGYVAPLGGWIAQRTRGPRGRYDPNVAAIAAIGLGVIGVAMFAAFIFSAGGLTALQTFTAGRSVQLTALLAGANKYTIFGSFVLLPASVIMLALGDEHRRWSVSAGGVLAAVALFLIAAPTGARSLMFPIVISWAIYWYWTRGRRPTMLPIAVAALIALTLSAFVVATRQAEVPAGGVAQGLVDDPAAIFGPITTAEDVSLAPGLAALLSLPDGQLPRTDGRAVIGDLLARPIPRSWWAGKPTPPRQVAARALFGRYADTLVANPEFTVVLYPYLDAGLVGVLAFMLLYGLLTRTLYDYTRKHGRDIRVRLLFALAVPVLAAGIRDGPVDTIARLAFVALPVVAVFTLARMAVPRAQGADGG